MPSTLLPSHFLIGAPASGKSTLARWLHTQQPASHLISTDEIRAELYGDQSIQGDWLTIEQVVLHRIHQAIAQGKPVIYDATNCYQPWRLEFLQKCPPMPWVAWYLACPLTLCLGRNQRRSRQVSPAVIQKMCLHLEEAPPRVTEGFVALITLPDVTPAIFRALKKRHPEYLGG